MDKPIESEHIDPEPVESRHIEPEHIESDPAAQEWDAAASTDAADTTPSQDSRDNEHSGGAGGAGGAGGETAIIGDVEDYASTEPLPAESSAAPQDDDFSSSEVSGADDSTAHDGSRDDLGRSDASDSGEAGVIQQSTDDRSTDEPAGEEPTTEDTWEDSGTTMGADDSVVNESGSTHAETSRDVEHRDGADRDTSGGADGETAIIGDVEDYASTEPLPAESSAAPQDDDISSSEVSGTADSTTHDGSPDDLGHDDAASADEPVIEQSTTDDSSATDAGTGTETESDAGTGTETESESEDREGSSDRGDATHWADGTDRINTLDDESSRTESGDSELAAGESVSDESDAAQRERGEAAVTDSTDTGAATTTETPTSTQTQTQTQTQTEDGGDDYDSVTGDQPNYSAEGSQDEGDASSSEGGGDGSRRISGVDEIRDGGFGVGSAAPFEDRAQPMDHPIQAYQDTRTFRVPGADGYDSAEPDVWFYDEEAARRAGFNPSQG